jgi:hypothetical protein
MLHNNITEIKSSFQVSMGRGAVSFCFDLSGPHWPATVAWNARLVPSADGLEMLIKDKEID